MVFATNERSRRTWKRLGFIEEGTLRDEYFHDGKWHDMVRMGLLEHEWRRPA
jgi:RimJ/RimL family protein N-acetyltransferase